MTWSHMCCWIAGRKDQFEMESGFNKINAEIYRSNGEIKRVERGSKSSKDGMRGVVGSKEETCM